MLIPELFPPNSRSTAPAAAMLYPPPLTPDQSPFKGGCYVIALRRALCRERERCISAIPYAPGFYPQRRRSQYVPKLCNAVQYVPKLSSVSAGARQALQATAQRCTAQVARPDT